MTEKESLSSLIERRVRDALEEMGDRTPREKESLAGAVERLLRAKPLASEGNLDLLGLLRNLDRGPKPLGDKEDGE